MIKDVWRTIVELIKEERQKYVNAPLFDKITLYSFWVIVASLITLFYWQELDNKPVVTITAGPDHIAYVIPGDKIMINQHVCIERSVPFKVKRRIADTIIFDLPEANFNVDETSSIPVGTCDDIAIIFTVPKLPIEQTYRYETTVEAKVNPFKTQRQTVDSSTFVVVDPDNPLQMRYRNEYLEDVDLAIQLNTKPLYVWDSSNERIILAKSPEEVARIRGKIEERVDGVVVYRPDLRPFIPENTPLDGMNDETSEVAIDKETETIPR